MQPLESPQTQSAPQPTALPSQQNLALGSINNYHPYICHLFLTVFYTTLLNQQS